MKKLITYSAVLASTVYLVGCGGGSDSSNAQPPNTTATIKVKNSSNFDYDTATIVSDSGVALSSTKINCVAGKDDCFIYVTNQKINESVNIYFKDAAGRVVRYYDVEGFLPEFLSINPSSWQTGLYLAKKIVTKNEANGKFDWLDTNLHLATFFKNYESPDGKVDDFEELGDYYSLKISRTSNLTEEIFLEQLSEKLKSWEVASDLDIPNSKIVSSSYLNKAYAWFAKNVVDGNFEIVKLAQAQTAPADNCSDGLSGFLNVVSNLGQLLPVIGDAISGVAEIGQNACSNDSAKWALLFANLKQLSDSVNNVGAGVTEIKGFLADSTIDSKNQDYLEVAGYAIPSVNNDNIRQINSDYETYLKKNGGYKTLLEYVDSKKSIAEAKKATDGSVNQEFEKLLYLPMSSTGKKGSILDRLVNLVAGSEATYFKAMNAKCEKLQTSSAQNFIHVRQQCNNILLANMSNLVGVQNAILPILADIYAVLAKFDPQGTYGMPSYIKSYATAKQDLQTEFKRQQTALLKAYQTNIQPDGKKPGLYEVYLGINTNLMKNMVNVGCYWDEPNTTRNAVAAITGWYAPTTSDKDNYIQTQCKTSYADGTNPRNVKARYYYTDQGSVVTDVNSVSNVLGVLVNTAYTSYSGYYTYNNSSGSDTAVLKKYGLNVTTEPKDPNVTVVGGNGQYERWVRDTPIVKTAGRSPDSAADGVWGEATKNGGFVFNKIDYVCNFGSSCKYNYNWLSFQDSKGFAYVIYYWAGGAWNGTNNPAGSATGMSCMTQDCEVVQNYTKVKFRLMDVAVDLR